MSELRINLSEEFHDREYRHTYANDWLNAFIATQIKVLREQRNLTQTQLGEKTKMAQPRVALLEDVNYSSWSINTLRRLAMAFDVRLSVKFETFSSLIPEVEELDRESLERDSFDADMWFHKKRAQATVGSEIFRAANGQCSEQPLYSDAKTLSAAASQGSTQTIGAGLLAMGAK
jgi:transcriptional regulator with XRE-family HTH domain